MEEVKTKFFGKQGFKALEHTSILKEKCVYAILYLEPQKFMSHHKKRNQTR